jgi:hypothetical protein
MISSQNKKIKKEIKEFPRLMYGNNMVVLFLTRYEGTIVWVDETQETHCKIGEHYDDFDNDFDNDFENYNGQIILNNT